MSVEDWRQMGRAIVWMHGTPEEVSGVEARNREVEAIHSHLEEFVGGADGGGA